MLLLIAAAVLSVTISASVALAGSNLLALLFLLAGIGAIVAAIVALRR